jgi:hypothetical protein
MRPRALLLLAFLGGSALLSAQGRTPARPDAPGIAPAARPVSGTFMASRIDREALPVTDRVIDEDGTEYLIEFDRLILSLRDDQRFRASIRYRRTLFSSDPRGRARATPLQSMTVTGTYLVVGDEIRFTPDATNETRGLRMQVATIQGPREISLPFHYRNGTRERDRTLVMQKRDDIL